MKKIDFSNANLLSNLLELAPNNKIIAVAFSELNNDPEAAAVTILSGLGVDLPDIDFSALNKNASVQPRSASVARIGRAVAGTLRKTRQFSTLQRCKSSVFLNKLIYTASPIDINRSDISLAEEFLGEVAAEPVPIKTEIFNSEVIR
ncbi:hypothetical protein NOR51B_1069 [Luminiphilus syltensis NOR5-1B]|uniref:Uncharacterized protein n=1 Tax=Luminiphilus syltensis NOR5-1B TaxID=565045 RepID=B8KV11_9GAMM|nr:hypothetical protein NOR51B_1069 [Luminiphilus syltensis NOR5-1B]